MQSLIQQNYFHEKKLGTSGGVMRFYDSAVGGNVSKYETNWPNAKASLPSGKSFRMIKVGIDIAHADGTAVSVETINQIRRAVLEIKYNGMRIIRNYRLSEFLSSPVAGQTNINAGTVFIQLSNPEEIKENIPLDVTLDYPIITKEVLFTLNLKGEELSFIQ